MEEAFAHCRHRMVMTDGYTPDGIVARLLADGFAELDATIQMALTGELAEVYGPALDFAPVEDEALGRNCTASCAATRRAAGDPHGRDTR